MNTVSGLGDWVSGFRFQVSCFVVLGSSLSSRSRVSGLGSHASRFVFRVSGFGSQVSVPGLGFEFSSW